MRARSGRRSPASRRASPTSTPTHGTRAPIPMRRRSIPLSRTRFSWLWRNPGSVGDRHTAWIPQHITIDDGAGGIAACAPCYAKLNSTGEYVFDHSWASAYAHAGGRYYPKLQIAVPFTPVPGRRLLVRADADAAYYTKVLASAAAALCDRLGASSVHVTFLSEREWKALGVARLSVAQRPAVPLAQRRLRDVRGLSRQPRLAQAQGGAQGA